MLKTAIEAAVLTLVLAVGVTTGNAVEPSGQEPPQVSNQARDFALSDIQGNHFSLTGTLKHGPAVLVVLRGYPGYQCPFCTKQFGELFSKAKRFEEHGASLVFVYPGPAPGLDKFAKEFIGARELPKNFQFLTDPDFKFTQQYGLRWDAPNETAYPSSFVIDRNGTIRFAKISHTHDDRARSADLIEALAKIAQ
jgi:thioredoxin-dependent peroxiredoxin